VLVLVPMVYRRCYCGGRAILLFFFRRPRQGEFIQHSAMAGDPCRFGSCGRGQRLAALGRPARSCHRSSPTAGNPRSSVRAVLPSPLDYSPQFSLNWKGSALGTSAATTCLPELAREFHWRQWHSDLANPPGRLRLIAPTFQEFEGFIVAAALKIMRQLWIDRTRQRSLQLVDLF
jgi:hypothetical protein